MPEGVTLRFQVCANSIDPAPVIVQSGASHELVREFVCSGNVTPRNRINESSLKLAADNL
jgi:hypothetical protein